jgi:hypothetical protein
METGTRRGQVKPDKKNQRRYVGMRMRPRRCTMDWIVFF